MDSLPRRGVSLTTIAVVCPRLKLWSHFQNTLSYRLEKAWTKSRLRRIRSWVNKTVHLNCKCFSLDVNFVKVCMWVADPDSRIYTQRDEGCLEQGQRTKARGLKGLEFGGRVCGTGGHRAPSPPAMGLKERRKLPHRGQGRFAFYGHLSLFH